MQRFLKLLRLVGWLPLDLSAPKEEDDAGETADALADADYPIYSSQPGEHVLWDQMRRDTASA